MAFCTVILANWTVRDARATVVFAVISITPKIGSFAPAATTETAACASRSYPSHLSSWGWYREYFAPLTVIVRGHGSGVTWSAGGGACLG